MKHTDPGVGLLGEELQLLMVIVAGVGRVCSHLSVPQ